MANIPTPKEFDIPKEIQQEFAEMMNNVVRSQTSRENPSTETTFEIGKNYIFKPINYLIDEERQPNFEANHPPVIKFNVINCNYYLDSQGK